MGIKCEPFEDLQIECSSNDYVGSVIESLRTSLVLTLENMENMEDQTRLTLCYTITWINWLYRLNL